LPIATFQHVPADLVRKRRVYGNNPARLTQFDCQKTANHVMMRCGGREAAHCTGFHQISPRCWGTRKRNGISSVRRASIGSSQYWKWCYSITSLAPTEQQQGG